MGGLDRARTPCYKGGMKLFLCLMPLLLQPEPVRPLPELPSPPQEQLSPLPGTPQLRPGLGYGGSTCEDPPPSLADLYGRHYRFAPGQEALRDAFHRRLLAVHPSAAERELPPEVLRTRSRCDASDIRLKGEGLWLAHFRDRVVAPATGRFRFVAEGDAAVTVRFNRQVVLDGGKGEVFSVTEWGGYPVEIIVSGGTSCTLFIEDLDHSPQAGEAPRDLFSCCWTLNATSDAPVWLLERYLECR